MKRCIFCKDGLISGSISLCLHPPKNVPNQSLEHFSLKKDTQESNLAHFFEDGMETLSEVNWSLTKSNDFFSILDAHMLAHAFLRKNDDVYKYRVDSRHTLSSEKSAVDREQMNTNRFFLAKSDGFILISYKI